MALALALLTGCGEAADRSQSAAGDAPAAASQPRALEGLTDAGSYRVRARPAVEPLTLHRMHDWIVGIELVGTASEIPTVVEFDGGMPAHRHGFVTRPRVTRNLGGGEFLVEGVKFHMPGEWVIQVTVTHRAGSEQVTLPLVVEP